MYCCSLSKLTIFEQLNATLSLATSSLACAAPPTSLLTEELCTYFQNTCACLQGCFCQPIFTASHPISTSSLSDWQGGSWQEKKEAEKAYISGSNLQPSTSVLHTYHWTIRLTAKGILECPIVSSSFFLSFFSNVLPCPSPLYKNWTLGHWTE